MIVIVLQKIPLNSTNFVLANCLKRSKINENEAGNGPCFKLLTTECYNCVLKTFLKHHISSFLDGSVFFKSFKFNYRLLDESSKGDE